MKKLLNSTWFKCLLPVVFYTVGATFIEKNNIEPLKRIGYAEQEEYSYYDRDGEEHEDETRIKIDGLGKILTYKDVYLESIPMFIYAVIFASFSSILNNGKLRNVGVFNCVIFANCILGILLISLTTRSNWSATLFFWLGIIAAYINLGIRDE